MNISKIIIYNGARNHRIDINEVAAYINSVCNVEAEIRGDLLHLDENLRVDSMAEMLARIRIKDINQEKAYNEYPLYGEIRYEKERLTDASKAAAGVVYDGLQVQNILDGLIDKEEKESGFLNIILTDRLITTWDENDCRHHLRSVFFGFPSIISISGIVEAPAKPREFYIKMRMGIDMELLKEEFRGRYIDYDDDRLTEVLKGYIMQAVFYHLEGEPFCDKKECRLFNAHWQEELIHSQIESGELCERHERVIEILCKNTH